MTRYVALLRAVNVGGTGKLPMRDLAELCAGAGFAQVRTYIASGNVVFTSDKSEDQVRSALEDKLRAYAGKPVGVIVRTAAEMAEVVTRNPFREAPGNRVVALFTDSPLPANPRAAATGIQDEELSLGTREIFIVYPSGMGASRLRIPDERNGTARNLNTIAKLAELASALP